MNRSELAKELNVWPWDVDTWLLEGCPGKKLRLAWEFDLEKVRRWLETAKTRIRRNRRPHSAPRAIFDPRWFGGRCPICIDKGFPAERAGRIYTLGEMLAGEWQLRRTGIPCGHSAYLDFQVISSIIKR